MTPDLWPDCTVLAFYGIDSRAEVAPRFYNFALTWFVGNAHQPNQISVHGPGFGGRPVAFSQTSSTLQRQGFAGVTNVYLVAMFPGGQIPVRDWLLNVNWSLTDRYAVFAAESSIVLFHSDGFRRYAEEVARLLQPEYGIAYEMSKRLAPDMFALGIGQKEGAILTGEAYEEARNVARWGDMGMEQQVWRSGVIRDVYPWNFLTAAQLNKKVAGCSLREWIGQDSQRGSLSELSDSVVLWIVPASSIQAIRQQLREARLFFDWRQFQ
jgi:hypothetical protein